MKARIAWLPGDGVGPEVLREARRVLEVIAGEHNHEFEFVEADIGGVAIVVSHDRSSAVRGMPARRLSHATIPIARGESGLRSALHALDLEQLRDIDQALFRMRNLALAQFIDPPDHFVHCAKAERLYATIKVSDLRSVTQGPLFVAVGLIMQAHVMQRE